ncbi:CopG family transcriptional regulator [Streptosporangium sp. NPDC023615]|uniref:CopG family transcriptional regulator n=1 Tax=Streptosporangium sp. NPDC023615 TaxID=3154794 RepID=UPI00341ACC11
MTSRFADEQADALRRRAGTEGRSVRQVVLSAVDEYLARRSGDEEVDRLAIEVARRWRPLLDRLAG